MIKPLIGTLLAVASPGLALANSILELNGPTTITQSADYSQLNAIDGALRIQGSAERPTTLDIATVDTRNQSDTIAISAENHSKVNITTLNASAKDKSVDLYAYNGQLSIGELNVTNGAHFSLACNDNSVTTIGQLNFTELSNTAFLSTIFLASETATLVFGGSYVNPQNNVRFDLYQGTLVLSGTMQCNELYIGSALKMVFNDQVFDDWSSKGELGSLLLFDTEVFMDDTMDNLENVIQQGLDEYAQTDGKYDVSDAYVQVIDGQVWL